MKFAKGRTQAAVKPQPAPTSGAASAALQQSPFLRQQAAQLMVIRQGAQQLLQRKQPDGMVSQQMGLEEEEPLQGKFAVLQQAALEEEEPLQGKFAVLQQAALEEEEPLQGKFEPAAVSQRQAEASNNTGMPYQLKSGIESLSGYAMDDVKVHYNSAKPAQMQAHAYAQGTDIHIAPGQEQHLPHEAWHVVQQKQGRVKATTQLKGEAINDDPGLEHEADVMGAKALQRIEGQTAQLQAIASQTQAVVQRLSHEYYDRAELRYSSRAFAHMSQGELEQYLWDNQSQIVVGQNQTILIGGGLRTGYAVNGNISYNCTYDERAGRHIIYVYHAHAVGRMG